MSKWTPEQIEEERIRQDIKHNVDYECVQFGKYILKLQGFDAIKVWRTHKQEFFNIEELYQLYLNDIDNSK